MKHLIKALFALLIVVASTKAFAQTEEKRQVADYHTIQSSGPFNVHIKIDGTESLKITGPSEVLAQIETIVEDRKLEIKFKHHYNRDHANVGKQPIDIYITAKSLSGLSEAGSGSITADGAVSGEDAGIVLSGSGSITAAVKSDGLNVIISGSGSVNLIGSAAKTKIILTGSGALNAKNLKTSSASVTLTGSGNAYFSADKSVSANIVGSGNITYAGNAEVIHNSTLGSGRISKAE